MVRSIGWVALAVFALVAGFLTAGMPVDAFAAGPEIWASIEFDSAYLSPGGGDVPFQVHVYSIGDPFGMLDLEVGLTVMTYSKQQCWEGRCPAVYPIKSGRVRLTDRRPAESVEAVVKDVIWGTYQVCVFGQVRLRGANEALKQVPFSTPISCIWDPEVFGGKG